MAYLRYDLLHALSSCYGASAQYPAFADLALGRQTLFGSCEAFGFTDILGYFETRERVTVPVEPFAYDQESADVHAVVR